MLSLFRTNHFVANALLIFYAAILRLGAFLLPVNFEPTQGGVLGELFVSRLPPESLGSALTAFFLVCFQALMINIILSRHRIANELTLLPGMFFILIASCIQEFLFLSPVMLACLFLVLSLSELFDTYKNYQAAGKIFNGGLWLGLSFLFYTPMLIYFFLALIALRTLRAVRLREQLMLLAGFLTPIFIAGVCYFVIDQYPYFLQAQFYSPYSFWDLKETSTGWELYAKLIFFGILVLLAILNFNSFMMKKKIQAQKYINIFFWTLLFAFLSIFFQRSLGLDHLFLLAPALGVFTSFNFLSFRKPTAEAFHLLILVIVLILQYREWWMI